MSTDHFHNPFISYGHVGCFYLNGYYEPCLFKKNCFSKWHACSHVHLSPNQGEWMPLSWLWRPAHPPPQELCLHLTLFCTINLSPSSDHSYLQTKHAWEYFLKDSWVQKRTKSRYSNVFVTAQHYLQLRKDGHNSSVHWWITKENVGHVHTQAYYAAMRRKRAMPFATWMDLKGINAKWNESDRQPTL